MQIQSNLTGVHVSKKDIKYSDHLAWFKRNYLDFLSTKDGITAMMDSITLNRWEKYFKIPHKEEKITNEDREIFEEYAVLNMSIEIDKNGDYVDDNTFQAWQFFKLGRKA